MYYRVNDFTRNMAGYLDLTAYLAMREIERKERQKNVQKHSSVRIWRKDGGCENSIFPHKTHFAQTCQITSSSFVESQSTVKRMKLSVQVVSEAALSADPNRNPEFP